MTHLKKVILQKEKKPKRTTERQTERQTERTTERQTERQKEVIVKETKTNKKEEISLF